MQQVLVFLRQNGTRCNFEIVMPSTPQSLDHGLWPPSWESRQPLLFAVGSLVIEDLVGSSPCDSCVVNSSIQCNPQILFDQYAAIGGVNSIAFWNDSTYFDKNIDKSTIGVLRYSSSRSAQLNIPTEDGKAHQVDLITIYFYLSLTLIMALQTCISSILMPQMASSTSEYDVLETSRVIIGVYAEDPLPGCRLGHVVGGKFCGYTN